MMMDSLKISVLGVLLFATLSIEDASAECEVLALTDAGNGEAYAEFDETNPTPEFLAGEAEICIRVWGVQASLFAAGLRPQHFYTAWWVVHEPFDPCDDFGPWYWYTCWDTTGAFYGDPPVAAIGRLGSALANRKGEARFTDWLTGYWPAGGTELTILLKEEGSLEPTETYPSFVLSAGRARKLLGSPVATSGDAHLSGITIGSVTLSVD